MLKWMGGDQRGDHVQLKRNPKLIDFFNVFDA
jgi:hypothetical protein